MTNGHCIGGFTRVKWSSPSKGDILEDKSAKLFNLTTRTCIPVDKYKYAIYCDKNFGPVFGEGDLGIKERFNKDKKCWSHANRRAYNIPEDSDGMN